MALAAGIYVCPDLDQDQRICRTISFYDLAELITFGALVFDQSAMIRYATRRTDPMPATVVGSDPHTFSRRDVPDLVPVR